MQERDLLLREKSALQAILASSAEEIRRLFEAEQKHVVEMKTVHANVSFSPVRAHQHACDEAPAGKQAMRLVLALACGL